jgi:uncharacterized protein YeaO (DUF488 family)
MNKEKLEVKFQAAVEAYVHRFLAFAEPHSAYFKELQTRHPTRMCHLSEIDPKDETSFLKIFFICGEAVGEIIEQNNKNGGVEDESDYAIEIKNFIGESMDLHVRFFQTNIAVSKDIIKFAKETNQRLTKDRNKFHKNLELQKLKREMDGMIAKNSQIIMLNQLELVQVEMMYSEVRNSRVRP